MVAMAVALAACAPEPLCVNKEGEELPICAYEFEIEGQPQTFEYCPGDEWGAADGCNSCGCDGKGRIVCTSVPCPDPATGT